MIVASFIAESIQLVPDGTILLHILLVLLMVAVLNRTLFGPINAVLSERYRKGIEATRESTVIERRVQDEEGRYRDILRSARTSGYKLMLERRSLDLKGREEEIESVKSEIEERILRERSSIEEQANAAKNGFDVLLMGKAIRDRVMGTVEDRGRLH